MSKSSPLMTISDGRNMIREKLLAEKKTNIHRFIIMVVTVVGIGLMIESVLEGWEFWFPPLLFIGILALWAMHITQWPQESGRENFFFTYAMVGVFFHGVHPSAFFDVAVLVVLMMITFSLLDRLPLLHLLFSEYAVIMIIQFGFAVRTGSVEFTALNIFRCSLHVIVVFCTYFFCRLTINNRISMAELLAKRDMEAENSDKDMEDFLVNVSHELRTPINVVNGMSTLVLKKEEIEEVAAIREAGLRLSCQVEDIQDFTEIRQHQVILEEERYMTTSLINDLVTSFRQYERSNELDLVMDLDPKVPAMMRGDIKKIHKIFRHLLDNAVKFTHQGGIYIRVTAVPRSYGVNLVFVMKDTGVGMSRRDIARVSTGLYQADRKRDRSTGGIGLGLGIVYGFVHEMGGFVRMDAEEGKGTVLRLTIPQAVLDYKPCLSVSDYMDDIVFYVNPGKYQVPELRDFYRDLAVNFAKGLKANLFSATTLSELKTQLEKRNVSHIITGKQEYEEDPAFFERLMEDGIAVAVSAPADYRVPRDSHAIVMPKPLYALPLVKFLNEGMHVTELEDTEKSRPLFTNVHALVVDDEPMNLVVATGLFKDYQMRTDTSPSGKDAIEKFMSRHYDVIFMDHMMPEMDGVEAMKRIKELDKEHGSSTRIVALTANAVSGAKDMFLKEGFDGFIAKPIDIREFERVMKKVLPASLIRYTREEG